MNGREGAGQQQMVTVPVEPRPWFARSQGDLEADPTVLTLIVFNLPPLPLKDYTQQHPQQEDGILVRLVQSAVKATIEMALENEREQNGGNGEEPKLHGRYHVYDLRSRTREENMSRFGAPYMGLEPEVPADQVDKIEWSLTRIEFSNKDDARTVRRLLNGKSLLLDNNTMVYDSCKRQKVPLECDWSWVGATTAAGD